MNNCKYNNGPKSSVEGTKISGGWGIGLVKVNT